MDSDGPRLSEAFAMTTAGRGHPRPKTGPGNAWQTVLPHKSLNYKHNPVDVV